MSLSFLNTLTRTKETFVPITPGLASLYTCGPTVYDFAHIGNMRTYIFNDTLRRVLEMNGLTVHHVMNITDVGHLVGDSDFAEDKVDAKAEKEGLHPLDIAKRYETAFFEDFSRLNNKLPTDVVRATEAVDSQIELIKQLEARGFTYRDDDAIYFDTSKLSDYGKLTGQTLSEKLIGAREEVVVDTRKRNPQDFVLWFFLTGRYAHHILHWASPWGEGFPGWHVECSAISRSRLGQPFDIHTGGVDHIGTHHTNEIAQSEAAYGEPLAHYWLHGEHLMVEGKRMGKSEGNLVRLTTVEEKGFDPLDFRYLVLTAHYRSRMNFTWDALVGARKTLTSIRELVAHDTSEKGEYAQEELIRAAFNDDLDTPRALALLHQAKSGALWRKFDCVLGLNVDHLPREKHEVNSEITALKEERDQARAQKDWAKADMFRHKIEALGYRVRDTESGSVLERL
ncbi:MAG TPA: cysteine--tRNA ligase [Patescibacteria group bacterium]